MGARSKSALKWSKPKHMKSQNAKLTREQWLQNAVVEMEPLFKKNGYKVPAVRVSCGWPISGGRGTKKGVAIGECWDKSAASDKVAQIFVSPRIKDEVEPCGVLATLVHEVVHAVVGNKEKHNKVFGKCARSVGLEGKLTHTSAGAELTEAMKAWVKKLGPYPHATLNPAKRPTKKQSTRMIKCECTACGYVVRTSAKWLAVGAPICPCNEESMHFELPEGADED